MKKAASTKKKHLKVVKGGETEQKLKPSQYMSQMRLSTDELLSSTKEATVPKIIEFLDLSECSYYKESAVDVDQPLFQPFPSQVVFQNYKPYEVYEVPLVLRNDDKVARNVRVVHEESPYVEVVAPKGAGSKVAPGMETTFMVRFKPNQRTDYIHELTCITEREKFVIPVKGVGARAILDFPDEVNFSTSTVKHTASKTLLIRNIGNRDVNFALTTNDPYSVSPPSGRLEVGAWLQVTVDFTPSILGDHNDELIIHYDTGEDVFVRLYGAAVEANVRLDKSSLILEKTFIGMMTERSITVTNRSDVIARYMWKALASATDDYNQKQELREDLNAEEEAERDEFLDECQANPVLRDRMSLLTRTFQNRRKAVDTDALLFHDDDVISIDPIDGEIWPNSQAEITVKFQPREAVTYVRTVYLDVTGREERLPLKIRGDGMGPITQLSFDTLDVGNLFVNSTHSYEVILQNKGDIDAEYSLLSSHSLFGPYFTFTPNEGILPPGSLQSIEILFQSPVLGVFSEDFYWSVKGATESQHLSITGQVIGPTFHFDVNQIAFGTVSYGFVNTRDVVLCNTSEVSMGFRLHVASTQSHRNEFDINPSDGTIEPGHQQRIQIDFTPATVDCYDTALSIDIEGVGEDVLSLPLTAESIVPNVLVATPLLDFRRCFLYYPYTQMLELVNETDLPARYELLAQDEDEILSMKYSSTQSKGIIQACSVCQVPLTIEACSLDEIAATAHFNIIGNKLNLLDVSLIAIGEGPVVNIRPTSLDWGKCPVLTNLTKTVHLYNEGLIPAKFVCQMTHQRTAFHVAPDSGEIAPQTSMSLTVMAYIDDCVRFNDRLTVSFVFGVSHTIHLSAHGVGTTITCSPSMTSGINFGPHFSTGPCVQQFTFKNEGRRMQSLSWTTQGYSTIKTKKLQQRKGASKLDISKPVFEIIPNKFNLDSKQKIRVEIRGYSSEASHVSETLVCHAIIGKNPLKEKIMDTTVSAQFISPVLQFSQEMLHFVVVQSPGSQLKPHRSKLEITNVSSLAVTARLHCPEPFSLIMKEQVCNHAELFLSSRDLSVIEVEFNPASQPGKHSREENSQLTVSYKEHPHTDQVGLKASVHFPNLLFETQELDFGCILNDTEIIRSVTATNPGPLPIKFRWSFVEFVDEDEDESSERDEGIDLRSGDEESQPDSDTESQMEEIQTKETEVADETEAAEEEEANAAAYDTVNETSPDHFQPSPDGSQHVSVGSFSQQVEEERPVIKRDDPTIEQIFDILPLHGIIEPGFTHTFEFTFFGHPNVAEEVIARCNVEEGPYYDIRLCGQASVVQYEFDSTTVECGKLIYDVQNEQFITLTNTGSVPLDYFTLDVASNDEINIDKVLVSPASGHVNPGTSCQLGIRFIPGIPKLFAKSFQVQVAHFEPLTITVRGEGVFPHIRMDLPRTDDADSKRATFKQQAEEIVKMRHKNAFARERLESEDREIQAVFEASSVDEDTRISPFEIMEIESEIDRLIVREYAVSHRRGRKLHWFQQTSTRKVRPRLPDYILDFGHIIVGGSATKVVRITNIGSFPVSFTPDKTVDLSHTGFEISLRPVKQLPGAPTFESEEFFVKFSTKTTDPLGSVAAYIPIMVFGGPSLGLQLKANRTMPDMCLSAETIEFGEVDVGECMIVTMQLHNNKDVDCEWNAVFPQSASKNRVDRFLPLHLKRKLKEKPKPKHFELIPSNGCLHPGERAYIQAKFTPVEEVFYSQKMIFKINQSSCRYTVSLSGSGREPYVKFSTSLLEFGPILPHCVGQELEVTVSNPTHVPIEIYSVDFDKRYRHEEEVLRLMKGYDSCNTLLLPPRAAGDRLPEELLQDYAQHMTSPRGDHSVVLELEEETMKSDQRSSAGSVGWRGPTAGEAIELALGETAAGVGELELTPVTRAIARYLGIDLSVSGQVAMRRRGISIIVHGPPLSGKTTQAAALSKKFGAALLTVDCVLAEAVRLGSTTAAIQAREKCRESSMQLRGEAGSSVTGNEALSSSLTGDKLEALKSRKGSVVSTKAPSQLQGEQLPKEAAAVSGSSTESRASGHPPDNTTSTEMDPTLTDTRQYENEIDLPPTLLPEELVADILDYRLQQSDCFYGVVFDGLDSKYTSSPVATASTILRAFNNRKWIFFVNVGLERMQIMEREARRKAAAEKEKSNHIDEGDEEVAELSEGEYESLPQEQQEEYDRKKLLIRKKRMKEKAEKAERERKEQELLQALLEEKRLEEERLTKRGRKGKKDKDKDRETRLTVTSKISPSVSAERIAASKLSEVVVKSRPPSGKLTATNLNVMLERSESQGSSGDETQQGQKRGKKSMARKLPSVSSLVGFGDGKPAEADSFADLAKCYSEYETNWKLIFPLLEQWDRTTGTVYKLAPQALSSLSDNENQESHKQTHLPAQSQSKRKSRKETTPKDVPPPASATDSLFVDSPLAKGLEIKIEENKEGIGVPLVQVNGNQEETIVTEAIIAGGLPSQPEILDGMGIGPSGPPLPPPTKFTVIHYPADRSPAVGSTHYTFVSTSADDPNIAEEEKSKSELESESQQFNRELTSLRESKKSASTRSSADDDRSTRASKRPTASSKQSALKKTAKVAAAAAVVATPPLSALSKDISQPLSPQEAHTSQSFLLTTFRWVIPASGSVNLRLRFHSNELGQFDQTLNFELLGTKRKYELYCRGLCAFPQISREPRIVFPHRKTTKKEDEIVHKKYVMDTETLEFGPLLLCTKPKDKLKAEKDPRHTENLEVLTIHNNSPQDCEVKFCLKNDARGEAFSLHPLEVQLKSGESQLLRVWAVPRSETRFEDTIVCCIKDNPEPVLFKVACTGVIPRLEPDRRELKFDKMVLLRKNTQMLYLRNPCLLPVAWSLNGLDLLGDDFSFSHEYGVIEPLSEVALQVDFRAAKQIIVNKKSVRVDVSDVDHKLGTIETFVIHVYAEAYDVAVELCFAKGTEGGLDFGCVRVFDDQKHQQVVLRTRTRYDIAYSFEYDTANTSLSLSELSSMFPVKPISGKLMVADKNQTVQVDFKPLTHKEVSLKDASVLKCNIIAVTRIREKEHVNQKSGVPFEPKVDLDKGGEVIAIIPVKVTAKSVFSKYLIHPLHDINFGALVIGARKQRQLTIENKGEFEFRYTILRMSVVQGKQYKGSQMMKRARSRDGSGRSSQIRMPKRAGDNSRQDAAGQQRVLLNMFSIYPATGIVQPGNVQTVNIDCIAESPCKSEELMAIDISDRNPKDQPDGISYKLMAESCIPAINITDFASIFEEHRVVGHLGVFGRQSLSSFRNSGVFSEDERKFYFSTVTVGHKTKARFKISNPCKIPCDVALSVKGLQHKSRLAEIFDIEPTKGNISPHSHVFATVTFSPPAMQSYSAQFEALLEGPLSGAAARTRSLSFEISGEGNLPHITVLQPAIRNKKNVPLLIFKRLLLGHTHALPLVLKNDGNIPATVIIETSHTDEVFRVRRDVKDDDEDDSDEMSSQNNTITTRVDVNETVSFSVHFRPRAVKDYRTELRLLVVDNQFENMSVYLVGEGYQDEITIDEISCQPSIAEEKAAGVISDDVIAAYSNDLRFGECFIGDTRQLSFCITNRSSDAVRFQWPSHDDITFVPSCGHIHPRRKKIILATFKATEPKLLDSTPVNCTVCKIVYNEPLSKIADWDDRMLSVKWLPLRTLMSPPGAVQEPSSEPQVSPSELTTSPHARPSTTALPTRRKVIETEQEPQHTTVDDTTRELEMKASGIADYSQFTCDTTTVRFRDTYMFQTRAYSFTLTNSGSVRLLYNWTVLTQDDELELTSRPGTALGFRSIEVNDAGSFVSEGGDIMPFSVEPTRGTIAVGESLTVTVRYSPLEAGDAEYHMKCNISNLRPNAEPPVIRLLGRSLLPYCHFELENSDYLTGGRRNPDLRVPGGRGSSVDPTTRVIEFVSCGVGVKITKRFHIVNPTNGGYEFVWECMSSDGQMTDQLRCLTPRGHVAAGKKAEIVFEFVSKSLETWESLWRFSIARLNTSVSFLLVGHTTEPAVSLDRSSVNFRSMLVRHTSRDVVHLINNESSPFHFSMDPTSCRADEHSARLSVDPMSGTIAPHSQLAVNITFTPLLEQEYNFNVQCRVRRKATPLTVNVKAEGYAIHASIVHDDVGRSQKQMTTGTAENVIDFDAVQINERCVRQVSIINSGRFAFDYRWQLNEKCQRSGGAEESSLVAVKPSSGTVACSSRVRCEISVCPPKKMDLSVCQLVCKILNGPSFPVRLRGEGKIPSLELSFTTHRFGPCFLGTQQQHKATLEMTNNEKRDISLHCLYSSSSHLEVQFQPCVLASGGKATAALVFHPQHVCKYRDVVQFEVNGLSRVDVEVLGEGIAMNVEVVKPAHRQLHFGALRVGQSKSQTVELVNKSVRDVTFSLSVVATSDGASDAITVTPQSEMTLKALTGSSRVTVVFNPRKRMKSFAQEMALEAAGLSQRLFIVTGSCHDVEFSLDSDHIPFGAVVVGSRSVRKLIMNNVGDIGANFSWHADTLGADFSISPLEGYLAPAMEASFDITFHPKDVNQDVRKDQVPCRLWIVEKKKEGKSEKEVITQCNPLHITLTGMAIGQQQIKEHVIQFSTHVRMKDTRSIALTNRSHQSWNNIQPVIDGEYWSGADSATVDPGATHQYELTYRPLVMTTEHRKHQGSIFFPLPEGSGLYYVLLGHADPPKPSGNISREVPCKTAYTHLLTVTNWLKQPQRFHATIEILKPDRPDPTTTLKGLDYIDVPAKAKKEYKLHFYSHKEGSINARVTFKNEQTGEFAYYFVAFKSTPPEVVCAIPLTTPARQMISRQVTLKNPLATAVTFTTSCNVPDISLPPNFTIPPNSEGAFTFEYMPIKVGEITGRLSLTSSELGLYQYDLVLSATQPAPERPVHFTTSLGLSQTQACRIVVFARQKSDFACKVDNADFHVERTINSTAASAGGSDLGIEVTYEPARLGDSKATLTVSSPSAGDYFIPLFGHCVVPKPQGPFTIKAGSSYQIPFKNVFSKTATFAYTLDSPVFSVKFNETIKCKKTHNLIVSYEPHEETSKSAPTMAKLVVTCSRSAVSGVPNIQWTYYLKGIIPY